MRPFHPRSDLAAVALLLSGCSLAPRYERPALPVPTSWPAGDAYLRASEAGLPTVRYTDIFRDARLQQLVATALLNNRDLRAASANIAAAREQFRIQRTEFLPQFGIGGNYTESDRGNGVGGGVGAAASGRFTNIRIGLNLTAFELDLFGRIQSLTDAAQNRYFATEAGARATRLVLTGEIANIWATYAADRELLGIAERTLAAAERSVSLTRARLVGGVAPRTDLRQAEQALEQARADLARSRAALAQDVNLLQLLVGAPVPSTLLPTRFAEVEATYAELPAGIDTGVLLRRPDVVQAEYQLRAANADIGVARALLFPRIGFGGQIGKADGTFGNLFDAASLNWSLGPTFTFPIFAGGAARANVRLSQAQRELTIAQYERTIQTAFREVSDALAVRGTIDEQLRAQRANVEASADNFRLSEARFRGGIDPFLQTLIAQQNLYTAERQLVTVRLARAQNLVQLYRTLGGDSQLDATERGPVSLSGG